MIKRLPASQTFPFSYNVEFPVIHYFLSEIWLIFQMQYQFSFQYLLEICRNKTVKLIGFAKNRIGNGSSLQFNTQLILV